MQVYPTTLSELVCGVARYDGAKPALIFADQPISYADLDMRIECAANSLALRGVVHGDRVALLIPNMPEFVVAYYAVLRCGGIVVPVKALYKAEEIAYILQDSEAKALILYAGFAAQGITGIAKAHLASQAIIIGDAAPEGATSWEIAYRCLIAGACTSQGEPWRYRDNLLIPPAQPGAPKARCSPTGTSSPIVNKWTGQLVAGPRTPIARYSLCLFFTFTP